MGPHTLSVIKNDAQLLSAIAGVKELNNQEISLTENRTAEAAAGLEKVNTLIADKLKDKPEHKAFLDTLTQFTQACTKSAQQSSQVWHLLLGSTDKEKAMLVRAEQLLRKTIEFQQKRLIEALSNANNK